MVARHFIFRWLALAACLPLIGLTAYPAVQIAGGVGAFVALLFLAGTMSLANSARCPTCDTRMSQGWDQKKGSSDGLFTCPKCRAQWRTKAVWGFD